jgi:DnaJ-class molecular chaperone
MPNNFRRCTCSNVMVRDNDDGTRDFKVVGKTGCLKCRSYGYVKTCNSCDGTGMLPKSGKCGECCGTGLQAVKEIPTEGQRVIQ